MATLTVTLSDEVKALAEARATAAGFADLGEYVAAMVHDEMIGGPPHLRVGSDEELEALLMSRIDGPFVETGPEDFARMRQKLEVILAARREPTE